MRELEKLSKNNFLLWVWTPIIWILSDRQKKKNTVEVFEETNAENFLKTGKKKSSHISQMYYEQHQARK